MPGHPATGKHLADGVAYYTVGTGGAATAALGTVADVQTTHDLPTALFEDRAVLGGQEFCGGGVVSLHAYIGIDDKDHGGKGIKDVLEHGICATGIERHGAISLRLGTKCPE